MTKAIAVFALIFAFACEEGPAEVDATIVDVGPDLEKDAGGDPTDAGIDGGMTDTGTVGADAGPLDGEVEDAGQNDGEVADAADAAEQDGDLADADPSDGDLLDGDLPDGDADGGEDAGPIALSEDFSDPVNEIFTCPDGTMVLPGLNVENGTQCLGIDGSGCPDERGLPGPGAVECSDPNHNPFIGAGQCVSDFFGCFDAAGTCTNDGAGTFTWGSGAMQVIEVDGTGRLIRSRFIPSTSTVPCIVGLPEMQGGTRVIYTQQ
jgi:hypothetical protein